MFLTCLTMQVSMKCLKQMEMTKKSPSSYNDVCGQHFKLAQYHPVQRRHNQNIGWLSRTGCEIFNITTGW